jgi:hypothetical protein
VVELVAGYYYSVLNKGDDMTCSNCGGENLTDYPVCRACAPKCHAIGRIEIGLNCIHCDIQANAAQLLQAAYMELIVEMDRLADLAQDLLAEMKGGGE